jgi:hypothetical protein
MKIATSLAVPLMLLSAAVICGREFYVENNIMGAGIGLYADPYRASWPIGNHQNIPREECRLDLD